MDPFFAAQFKRPLEIIQKSGVDPFTNWMDVQSKTTVSQRNLARSTLSRIPDIQSLRDTVLKEREQFKRKITPFSPRCDWVGNLIKRDGQWSCVTITSVSAAGPGDLYLFRQAAGQTVRPVRIGHVDDSGKFIIQGNDSACIQCLPVFFVQQ